MSTPPYAAVCILYLRLLGQLSLLPSAGREMSTGQSAVMLCAWGKRVWGAAGKTV